MGTVQFGSYRISLLGVAAAASAAHVLFLRLLVLVAAAAAGPLTSVQPQLLETNLAKPISLSGCDKICNFLSS